MAGTVERTGGRSALREFLDSEAAGGVLLMAAAALALIAANGPFAEAYHHILHDPIGPELSRGHGPLTAHLLINDGLMAIFFLLVGLEIKREFLDGRLSSWDQRRLPFIAAAVGMGLPALLYLAATAGFIAAIACTSSSAPSRTTSHTGRPNSLRARSRSAAAWSALRRRLLMATPMNLAGLTRLAIVS